MESIDTIVMGGRTYRELITMTREWTYKEKTTYVISRYKNKFVPKENIKYISKKFIETISQLKETDKKDIWLVGGGQIITTFLNENLIDEMQICYIPVILGKGIPLFSNYPRESKWDLITSKSFDSGILKTDYRRIRN